MIRTCGWCENRQPILHASPVGALCDECAVRADARLKQFGQLSIPGEADPDRSYSPAEMRWRRGRGIGAENEM